MRKKKGQETLWATLWECNEIRVEIIERERDRAPFPIRSEPPPPNKPTNSPFNNTLNQESSPL